jgi:N-methylhydantoinase B
VTPNSGYAGRIPEFELLHFNSGGSGARPLKNGMSATAFPSGVRGMPVEASEAITPIIFWRKEFREDSGGAGTYRGGLGQVIEIGGADGIPFDVLAMFERVDNAPRGRNGGGNGAAGRVTLASGTKLRPKGQQTIPPHDRLRLEMAGGGGFGPAWARDPELVAEDVRNGLVSAASARQLYGVALDADGQVDTTATATLRQKMP